MTTWFLAIFLLTQSKTGLSALALARHLGVTYKTAWLVKHKLMQTMRERDDTKPLTGSVQVDDALWGGERMGDKRGRGAARKTPVVAAVACSADGRPLAMRMTPLKGFRSDSVDRWARQHLSPDAEVTSDGLHCFRAIVEICCTGALSPAAARPACRSRHSPGSTLCSVMSKTDSWDLPCDSWEAFGALSCRICLSIQPAIRA